MSELKKIEKYHLQKRKITRKLRKKINEQVKRAVERSEQELKNRTAPVCKRI